MKKRILALALAALMLLSLGACSASSSSTSTVTVSTSVTDENGNTTTNTTTNEVGVSVGTDGITTTHNTETTSTTTDKNEEIVNWWYETYKGGAIGENAAGDRFLLAYDDPENITAATLTIISADGSSIYIREGSVRTDGEGEDQHLVLDDDERDVAIPFDFYESDKGDFEMYFYGDGDTAVMNAVDQDTILGEMRSVLETTTAVEAANSAPAK